MRFCCRGCSRTIRGSSGGAAGNFAALWGGWWHWTLPLVPFLVWTLLRDVLTVPGFFAEVVGKEFLGRFTVGENAVHHNQPVTGFTCSNLLKQWLPWDVLLHRHHDPLAPALDRPLPSNPARSGWSVGRRVGSC